MLRKSQQCMSIMERYRRIRPVVLDQLTTKQEYQKPTEEEKKFFDPWRTPSLPSYIRSPVPLAARVFSQSTSVVQPADPRRLRVALVGSPNAGQTSLLNSLLGKPIGAVSKKLTPRGNQ